MTITLTSTTRIVDLRTPAGTIAGRIWEGTSAEGVPVIALITRITIPAGADQATFDRELESCAPPTDAAIQAFPSRLVL